MDSIYDTAPRRGSGRILKEVRKARDLPLTVFGWRWRWERHPESPLAFQRNWGTRLACHGLAAGHPHQDAARRVERVAFCKRAIEMIPSALYARGSRRVGYTGADKARNTRRLLLDGGQLPFMEQRAITATTLPFWDSRRDKPGRVCESSGGALYPGHHDMRFASLRASTPAITFFST